ncbi:MAG: acetate--CoA ligase [Bdellovibrionota bacterium]
MAFSQKRLGGKPQPNLSQYEEARASFDWEKARAGLSGLPHGGGLNIAYECVDRHVDSGRGRDVALRWIRREGDVTDFSYESLKELTSQFAHVLEHLGVKRGETVFSLLGRVPELYITALGTLKRGAVFCPLFSAFGPEPVKARMLKGSGKVLVTTESFYRKKVEPIRHQLPQLRHVLLLRETLGPIPKATEDFALLLEAAERRYEIGPTREDELALLHFTSGTTGLPKGAMHVHQAVLAHFWTGKFALDLHSHDIFWCTADPGWVTGTSYGIISPLANGITSIVDEGDFDAQRWYGILKEQRVNVWYTAPTAVRMAMKAGTEVAKRFDFPDLRFIGSVGEPLNPESVYWGMEAFGLPIHDNWWQTETGGIMVANFASMDIKPGSMGRPLPGVEAVIAERGPEGVKVLDQPGQKGELALKVGWPSMFRGYLNEEERYRKCFADGYYFTGDLATRDSEGYFWFVGRADDVIKSSGHLIGPFEVEKVLMEHPAVLEAAAIGKPDPIAMESVKAFVALKRGITASDDLNLELLGFARARLGPVVAPKEIVFLSDLPKTKSGKILRRLLKARELGLPEGDLSTLEGAQP